MLTNTVILLLRDILPIFVFAVYLKHVFGSKLFAFNNMKWHAAMTAMLVLLFTFFIEEVTAAFSGAGYELLNLILNAVVVVLVVLAIWYYQNAKSYLFVRVALVLFAVLKLTGFMLFTLSIDIAHVPSLTLVGFAFGIAICLSVSILLSFLLSQLNQISHYGVFSLFALFVAAQAAAISPLLQQIDWYEGFETAYDLSWLVSDKSEYGHVLKTLVGFEASPSYDFLAVYMGVFVLLIMVAKYRVWPQVSNAVHEAEGV